ncbi:phosphodiesterase [archaeon]|nr:phosphodiesterase [archaeon]
MRLLCISDIHGRYKNIKKIESELREADIVILAGDITNFGDRGKTMKIIREFMKYNSKILAVHGNCDLSSVNDALKELKVWLHGRSAVINGTGFFGLGGSNITPFATPQEYSEEKLSGIVEKAYNSLGNTEKKILISHTPPYGILDGTGSGTRAGSKALRNFIRDADMELVICGHVHEAKGIEKWQGKLIINPGPIHMGYAVVDINDNDRLEAELISL